MSCFTNLLTYILTSEIRIYECETYNIEDSCQLYGLSACLKQDTSKGGGSARKKSLDSDDVISTPAFPAAQRRRRGAFSAEVFSETDLETSTANRKV